MKKRNPDKKQPVGKEDAKFLSNIGRTGIYILTVSVFILSLICFGLFFNYVFFYQEKQSLFVYSYDYLSRFVSKPGGMLEYAGNFIAQGFFSNLYGAIVVSVFLAAIALVYYRIAAVLTNRYLFPLLLAAIAACLLILIQTNINYQIHNSLGFLAVGLYFLFAISQDGRNARISVFVFFPFFYYLTGAFALIFLGMFISYHLFRKEFRDTIIILLIAGVSLVIFKRIISLQPWLNLFYDPLPGKDYFIRPWLLWLFLLFFVLYPALVSAAGNLKVKSEFAALFPLVSSGIVILLTVFMLSRIYKHDNAVLFNIERMFFSADWNGVIRLQEKHRLRSPVAQYYYNIALSEKGLLCDRLFFGPQDYGTGSISIPWNSQISMTKIFRGVYFYYSIGLINEAHRWAFESMVVQGFHPENIKMLIKTNLINGHYKIAAKYIYVLKKTFHYRKLAKEFEKMLSDPELIKSDPELGEKIRLKPNDDFIIRIRNPKMNIISLSESNPHNKKAFEYKMAWRMLEKDVEDVVGDLSTLIGLNYSRIPRHIEEALLIYRMVFGQFADLNLVTISSDTEARFSRYRSVLGPMSGKKYPAGTAIPGELRNTYWYYLDFKK
ncbi:MAG TPA: DUF6057 family protein [Bacteroidales bacterium]|nr:hypothetical protein [Bacteroidales bacterium]HNR41516.1 DUF6057 family protein [Bacteroidales bacterium]HPM19021.1 DUF6057 family protein [Bacteroidales bacterium]HQG77564.1 DUF6057 family protein [Bacteroidales bacterium]